MELTVEELSLLRDAFDTGQKFKHGKSDRKKGNSENRGHFRKLAAAWDEMPAGAKAEIMVAFSVRLSVDPERLINPSIFDLGPVFSSVIDEGMNSGGRKDALPGFHHLCAFAVFAWFQQNDSRDAEIGNVPLPEHLEKASPLLRFVADAVEQVLEPGEWARATQLPSKPDRHALLTAVRSQLQKLRKSGAI